MKVNELNFKVVKQPRRLTYGLYRLSVVEKRIVLRIIQALQPEVNDILKGKVKVKENLFGDKLIKLPTKSLIPEGSKHHNRLRKALSELPLRRILLKCYSEKEGSYDVYTGFILQSKFYERRSVVEVQISKDMLPIYLNIINGYTSYKLAIAFQISSSNTIRLYEILSSWINAPFAKRIMFDDLKRMLGLEKKYPNSAQFKKKVLEPAMKELEEKADVWFSIKAPIKEGRKVVGWKIQIHKRKELLPSSEEQANTTKEAQEREARLFAQERANLLALRDKYRNK